MAIMFWIIGALILVVNASQGATFNGLSLIGWALVAITSLVIVRNIGGKNENN